MSREGFELYGASSSKESEVPKPSLHDSCSRVVCSMHALSS